MQPSFIYNYEQRKMKKKCKDRKGKKIKEREKAEKGNKLKMKDRRGNEIIEHYKNFQKLVYIIEFVLQSFQNIHLTFLRDCL